MVAVSFPAATLMDCEPATDLVCSGIVFSSNNSMCSQGGKSPIMKQPTTKGLTRLSNQDSALPAVVRNGFARRALCATSVFSVSLRRIKASFPAHHRDIENTAVAQRNPNESYEAAWLLFDSG